MVFPHRTVLLIILVTFALVIGCSGGGGEAPTSPEMPDNELTPAVTHSGANNTYIWEIGEVVLDTENQEVSVVPLRTADFTCNITMFLQPPNGNPSNLGVSFDLANSDFPNAYVDLDCTLTHPFPGTQYWGFDVRVIVFGGGSTVGVQDSTVRYPTPTELRMVNADGYTRWWNRDEFGPFNKLFGYTDGIMTPNFTTNFSIVNGYKFFAEDIGANDMPPNPAEATRSVFSSGSHTREMLLQFPQIAKPFKFKYSVSASWAGPTVNPPTSVDDFGPDANTQEAYQIVVTQDPASTAFYDPGSGDNGGDLILNVEVWDWQAEGNAAAQINEIWIESPTLLSSQGDAVEITGSWASSPGSSPNSVIYSGTLAGCTPADSEDQELFITVVSEDPTTYEPPQGGFLYPGAPLAAYQLFEAFILDTSVPTIIVIAPNDGETLVIGESFEITWSSMGPITDVVIEYDVNGGGDGYPNTISPAAPNTGSYTWDPIPDTPSVDCMLRITDAGATGATDTSDDVWIISTEAASGWNPIPGQIGMPLDPEPNQSTVSPDLGSQNTGAGDAGEWMVDQEGGIPDGTPYFFDYQPDWSGPGGNEYPSGFNYNFAPFNRHDVCSTGVAIMGCSANDTQMAPPTVNDTLHGIWYLSYILDDGTASAGELVMNFFGDQGSTEPPEDDPDERPWYQILDCSGGMWGDHGLPIENDAFAIAIYSQHPDAPDPESIGSPGQYDSGDLVFILRQYPFYDPGSFIYRWGLDDWTTDNEPAPVFNAFDVSDPLKPRVTVDNDSYLVTGWVDPYEDLAVGVYMIDADGNFYGTLFEMEYSASTVWYLIWDGVLKMRPDDDPDDLYLDGHVMVDLEILPTIRYLHDGDYEQDKNWVAVLYDDLAGNFVLRVYRIDWTVEEDIITIVDTCAPIPGTPLALDVDTRDFTVHVIADDGGNIEGTAFGYTL